MNKYIKKLSNFMQVIFDKDKKKYIESRFLNLDDENNNNIKYEKMLSLDKLIMDIIEDNDVKATLVINEFNYIEVILRDDAAKVLNMEEIGFLVKKILENNIKIYLNPKTNPISLTDLYKDNLSFMYYYNQINSENGLDMKSQENFDSIINNGLANKTRYFFFYQKLNEFLAKNYHSDTDYDELNRILTLLNIPNFLKAAFIYYYQQSDAKKANKELEEKRIIPVKKIETKSDAEIISKKKLKEKYNQYEQNESFDLTYINDVLAIIKQMQIPNERYGYYLGPLYRKTLKNNQYYNFIFEKASYLNANPTLIKQAKEYQLLLEYFKKEKNNNSCDKEINETKDILYSIGDKLSEILYYSFDYEIYLNSDKKTKRA